MKIGILGAGNIAGTMAHTISGMEEAEKTAVASRTLSKAQAFAGQHGFEKAYGSYEELAADPEVELIYIATPHSLHYEHIKLCLAYGKHVLAEKAFTQNAAQAREVLAMAEEKKLLLAEAIWTRYIPMRKTLNEVLASGVIGTPRSLYATLSYPIMHVERLAEPSLAGGALLDLGVYTLNFASMVFGNDIGHLHAQAVLTEKGVDAAVSMQLLYPDGRLAVLHSDARAADNREGAIYGERGYVLVKNINNCEGITVFDSNHRLLASYETPPQITGYEYEVLSCINAIKTGAISCPEMPHSETLLMMEWMDEARRQIGVRYPGE